ncbi:MAG: 4-hydroxy-tetrahydrodipicolinate reductase [Ruminococcus sp.]|nr:4-hydroxy-tetrahydrodipicolinate reductase [Ruminococcus sp.]
MVNIALVGCNGRMGKAVSEAAAARNDCKILFGADPFGTSAYEYPVYKSLMESETKADVIIDFSNPALLDDILEYAVKYNTPCVICTTGFSADEIDKINKTSEKVAVFRSGNMSLGINLLIELSKEAAKLLGNEFDIEIIEKHHNQKLDAPSGTALMLADGISEVLEEEPQYVYDRHSYRKKRAKNEIGIHAVRGGTIVGEHEVIFAGHDEVVSLTHQAQSREVFAVGAVNAAIYLASQGAGMYNMSNLLSSKLGL